MDTLEITGTTCGTPRLQWAAEANAGTSTGRGVVQSCVYMEQPAAEGEFFGASLGFWAALTNYWELVRLSRRTPWRTIIGPELAQGSVYLSTLVAPYHGAAMAAPVGDVEMLGRVKHYLSLNMSELAAVLNVGRPTVYAWMQGGPIRPGNRERLAAVYHVAQDWWKRAGQPLGSFLHLQRADGQSMLDLLKADPVDAAKLEPFLKVATHRLERAAQEKNVRAASYDVLAKRHGFAPVPEGVRDCTLRQFGQGGKKT
ncbi:MAG: hypothetical protein PHQ04_03935 [Opitutaceae bacterium]|nr:hypothetical protein [Opitutaceae bacterium]